MRFTTAHHFDAPPDDVAALLVDPAFYESLELPDLGPPEVVDHRAPGPSGGALLVLRYEYTGSLDPLARRLLGGHRMLWTQELRLDSATSGVLSFRAEASPRLLHGRADLTLGPDGPGTVRRMEGEIVVAVPGLGRMAERRVVAGVLRRLDVEAAALARRLGPG